MTNLVNNSIYKLKYAEADTGAGKTYQTIKEINRLPDRTIVVQNTKKLIQQTQKDIIDSKFILDDINSSSVFRDVITFLMNPTHKVLLITDKSFLSIRDLELLKGWRVYIDDVVGFHSFETFNTTKKREIEFEIFFDFKNWSSQYVEAKKLDQFTDDLVRAMADEFKIVNQYDYFMMNSNFFDKKFGVDHNSFEYCTKCNQLTLFAWIDLEKYLGLDIIFMANKFEETLLYLSNPTIFEKIELKGLRVRVKPIKERMKVFYFSKKNRLTKNYRKENKSDLKKVIDYINTNVCDDYYYTINKDVKEKYSLRGIFISPDTRGINDYQQFTTCVWLASLKPKTVEMKVCELLFKITKKQIITAREYESIYQFVNRSNLRVFSSEKEVSIYVFDQEQALSLTDNIEYIDIGLDSESELSGIGTIEYIPLKLNSTKAKRLLRITLEKYPTNKDFDMWMNKKNNKDLTERERDHFYKKYNNLRKSG